MAFDSPNDDQEEALRILHEHHLYASEEGIDNVVESIVQDVIGKK